MKQMEMTTLALAGVAALTLSMGSVLAAGPGEGHGAQDINFVEEPGNLEFSGYMIARPVQDDKVAGQAARDLINTNYAVFKYIDLNDEYVIEVPHGQTENSVARTLMATGNFEYVEPDWICFPQLSPNDPYRGSQWQHTRMQSYDGWDYQIGDPDVVVAICDTGLRTTHEEFQLYRKTGYNYVRRQWENQGGNVMDIVGHGTHTSGCAAANGNNNRGGLGVGWQLGHRIIRVSESADGSAQFTNLTGGALFAAQQGDKCISVSYSGVTSSSVRSTAASIRNIGGILFWAAGNEGRNLSSPDRDADKVIVVGATTSGDGKASFSNYGAYVDLMAPGDNIFSTWYTSNSSYASLSGTSMACPIAAGVGAMIFSNYPNMPADDVEALLKSSCDDLGANGVDNIYGYGRVNLFKAMTTGGTLTLTVNPQILQSGGRVSFYVTGGRPNTLTGVYYSTAGLGSWYVGELNVVLDITRPKRVTQLKTTNSNGDATWGNLPVPTVSRRVNVWFQAAQDGGPITDVIATRVDP